MKISIILFFFVTSLFAQDFTFDKDKGKTIPNYVGEIKLFRGKVFKIVNGEKKEVQAGTRCFKDETLVTEDKSFAKVIMVDETIMSLGQNSKLNFAEFKFIDKKNRHIVYSLVEGQLSGHVKNKAQDGDVVVKTRVATMGIRGTEILVNHRTLNGKELSQFALLSGAADVTDLKNEKHPLTKAKKIALVHDFEKDKGASAQAEMTPAEFQELSATDKDEEKDFKPFLPYIDTDNISKESPLYATLHDSESVSQPDENHEQEVPEDKKQGSFNNLKRLNDKLKENQQ